LLKKFYRASTATLGGRVRSQSRGRNNLDNNISQQQQQQLQQQQLFPEKDDNSSSSSVDAASVGSGDMLPR